MTITAERNTELEQLFAEHRLGLTRLAHVIVGSNARAQELVQEAFIRYARASGVREPVAYLRTILVNLCRSEVRRAARPLPLPDPALSLDEPVLDETWHALQRLPIRYRTALALRFYVDMSEAQIAEQMECRPGTVKSLIHRGLELLRKELES